MNRPPEPNNRRPLKIVLFLVLGVPFLLVFFSLGVGMMWVGADIIRTERTDVRPYRMPWPHNQNKIHFRGKSAAVLGASGIAVGLLFCVETLLQGTSIVVNELLPGGTPDRAARFRKISNRARIATAIVCGICWVLSLILYALRI
ncbi:hypothetical protein JCM19992_01640 [Thermostilla marina]